MNYEKLHVIFKEGSIHGRYLNLDHILPLLNSWHNKFEIKIAGNSLQGRSIYKFQIGTGKIKVLMWSQMHGNESTTTKGLIDFMNLLNDNSDLAEDILRTYSFTILPMLNPDGAEVYTRVNANEIDLNRDFQQLTQPESQVLMKVYDEFKPDYCYNLHDQRTIFGVGTTGKAATVSFLAPSFNEEKEYDASRLKSVQAIIKMVKVLQTFIPVQIGRFDDGFNINCVGDTFQSLGTPTILIEAGHFPEDYQREETRKFIFISLLASFHSKYEPANVEDDLEEYLGIPQNTSNLYDLIYRNVRVKYENSSILTNFAIQYKEHLIDDKIIFIGFIVKIGTLDEFYGHFEFNADGGTYSDKKSNIPKLEAKASFCIDKKPKFVNGLVKK